MAEKPETGSKTQFNNLVEKRFVLVHVTKLDGRNLVTRKIFNRELYARYIEAEIEEIVRWYDGFTDEGCYENHLLVSNTALWIQRLWKPHSSEIAVETQLWALSD